MYQFFAVGHKVASIRATALLCLMVFKGSTQGPSTTPGSPSIGDVLKVIPRLSAVSVLWDHRASSLERMTAAKGGLSPHDRIAR